MEHFILMSAIRQVAKTKNNEQNLKNVIGVINKIHKKSFITNLDMVLADEFQGITNSLDASLQIIFDIEECIIENNLDFKLKHVLYHDTIDSVQSKHNAYERLGFGLIDARQRLDLIKKTDTRFLVTTSDEKRSLYFNNLFLLYEDYLDAWKLKDYDFVKAFLNNTDYKEVASMFKLNISSAWRKERALKMKQYYTVKEMILAGVD